MFDSYSITIRLAVFVCFSIITFSFFLLHLRSSRWRRFISLSSDLWLRVVMWWDSIISEDLTTNLGWKSRQHDPPKCSHPYHNTPQPRTLHEFFICYFFESCTLALSQRIRSKRKSVFMIFILILFAGRYKYMEDRTLCALNNRESWMWYLELLHLSVC